MQISLLQMLEHATLTVKIVLVILAAMSLGSWTIIFYKLIQLNMAKRDIAASMESFQAADSLAAGLRVLELQSKSTLFGIGKRGVDEYRRLRHNAASGKQKSHVAMDNLRRVLRQGVSEELNRLSASLSFLATCANAAPFIGLFGTVWGIMHSFHSIGMAKTAALAAVAPGISEALVATAIGLAVAIPATVAFNFFRGMMAGLESELVSFAGAFLNHVEREGVSTGQSVSSEDMF
ncbi:MAG: MotA/TolQ/ExbB proton channel family protein [Desulfovibrionaceae bacterium]